MNSRGGGVTFDKGVTPKIHIEESPLPNEPVLIKCSLGVLNGQILGGMERTLKDSTVRNVEDFLFKIRWTFVILHKVS